MEYVHNSWDKILADQFNAPYFDALMQRVNRECDSSTVYPPKDKIFAALRRQKIERQDNRQKIIKKGKT